MNGNVYIKAIDHCIEKMDDLCGKCIYAKNFNVDFYGACKHFDKEGNVACRNGIIKYFEKGEKHNG